MLDIASSELLLVVLVALIVIGPKDLPKVLRVVGKWMGKARGVASQFRAGFDEMVRQSELEELEKKWQAENDRIIRETTPAPEPVAAVEPELEPVAPAPKPKRVRKPRADPAT